MTRQYLLKYRLTALLVLPMMLAAASLQAAEPEQDLQLLHVKGKTWMVSGTDVNVTVQIGDESVVFVDSPAPELADEVMALVREKTTRPVSYVISTHLDPAHIAGNQRLIEVGNSSTGGGLNVNTQVAAAGAVGGVTVLAHENVLNRFYLTEDHGVENLLVTNTYFTPTQDFFMNDEGIVVYHVPGAHTDGDSLVHFRTSDVISTGDIFVPGQYPDIDVERGGSAEGFIDALNFLLELIVPGPEAEGGTYVVPGHGRIGDEIDVVEYRNMLVIMKERIEEYMNRGMSLEDIMATDPTVDYDTEYGGPRGGPTSEEFVTAIYRSLQNSTGVE